MSNLSLELSTFYEPFINHPINITYDSLSLSEIETIQKTKFAEHFHLLCKYCEQVPKIRFLKNKKIAYKCGCKDLIIDDIRKVYEYLDYSDITDVDNIKLKCQNHADEKYCLYCSQCGKNLCYKCANGCIDHQEKISIFPLDKDIINKRSYIIEKIKDKNQTYIDDENNTLNKNYFNSEEGNTNKIVLLPKKNKDIIENDSEIKNDKDKPDDDGDDYLIIKTINNNIINDEAKDEIKKDFKNISYINNNDESVDEEYYLINLFSIIVDDFQNYPNYELNKIIDNLEKFIFFYYDKFQKIDLKYEFEKKDIKNDSIKILGEKFFKNNKEKCFLIIKGKLFDLYDSVDLKKIDEFFNLDLLDDSPINLEVELVERLDKQITDLSYMFEGISYLMKNSKFNDFDSRNIVNTEFMFHNCSSIIELPDISNLNFSNVTNMNNMFSGCKSLKQLPDMSKWDTNKLINIESLFENCESLTSLPDISNWNFSNVFNISYMFSGCKSLKHLPDISKWDTKKLINIESLFENCKSLTSLPDISNWNINKNITNKNKLIRNCKSLENIPNLYNLFSKEELKNNYIFEGCTKLEEKAKENNEERDEAFLERLPNICDKLSGFWNNISNCLNFGCKYCKIIIWIFCVLTALFIFFSHLIISFFYLDKSNKFFNDSKTYFYLLNYTNISRIAKVMNITNSSKIKEIEENKEDFINKEMNFTYINGNITFESSQKCLRLYGIIIASVLILNILFLCLLVVKESLMNTSFKILIIFLILLLIIDMLDVIIEIKYLIYILNFSKSFDIFKNKLYKLFKKLLSQSILKEYGSLFISIISVSFNILASLLFLCIFNLVYDDIIRRKRNNLNNSYEKNKNIIDSNINNLI